MWVDRLTTKFNGKDANLEARRRQRECWAKGIDPRTAILTWVYGQILDPYGEDPDLPADCQCVGRNYFLYDPDVRGWVLESEVRALHPEIPAAEWDDLMQNSAARDHAFFQ